MNFAFGYYIKTCDATVSASNYVQHQEYAYCKMIAKENDIFHIHGIGGSAPRLWCFVDKDYTVLSNASEGVYLEDNLIAPKDSAYIIINVHYTDNKTDLTDCYYNKLSNRAGKIEDNIASLISRIEALEKN